MEFTTSPPTSHTLNRRDVLRLSLALPVLASVPSAAAGPVLPFDVERPEADLAFTSQFAGCTAIARVWPVGAGYCGRCPRASCHVEQGVCLVIAPGYVDDEDALDYSYGEGRDGR